MFKKDFSTFSSQIKKDFLTQNFAANIDVRFHKGFFFSIEKTKTTNILSIIYLNNMRIMNSSRLLVGVLWHIVGYLMPNLVFIYDVEVNSL